MKKKHQQQFPDFRFIEKDSFNELINAKIRHEYFPVYFVYPHIKSKNIFGYDLASEKRQLSTLKSSQQQGKPLIIEQKELTQEKATLEECLAFLPIFTKNESKKNYSPEDLKGFVHGVFKFSEIFETANNATISKEIQIQLLNQKDELTKDTLFTYQPLQNNYHKSLSYQIDSPNL
jgi:sensor domain CHASE-containing protein